MPEGVTLRAFVAGQDEAEVAAGQQPPPSPGTPSRAAGPSADVGRRRAEPWFDPAGFLLAVDAADDGCSASTGPRCTRHGDEPAVGEVYVVGVDPAAQGRGLGRR